MINIHLRSFVIEIWYPDLWPLDHRTGLHRGYEGGDVVVVRIQSPMEFVQIKIPHAAHHPPPFFSPTDPECEEWKDRDLCSILTVFMDLVFLAHGQEKSPHQTHSDRCKFFSGSDDLHRG